MADDDVIRILGAGLSGLAAATILAKNGKKVEVYETRQDSGARFDGDFQGLENWTSSKDFFEEMVEWGLDPNSFKSTDFTEMALIHPDDEITTPRSDRIAFRIVERGTDEHCIDQGFKRMAMEAGATIHYNTKADPRIARSLQPVQKTPVQSHLVKYSRPVSPIMFRSS